MVVDLISIVTNQPATSFDHQLGSIELPDSIAGHLATARKLREQTAGSTKHDAAEEARKAARELSEDGVPLRDIGRLRAFFISARINSSPTPALIRAPEGFGGSAPTDAWPQRQPARIG